MHRTVLLPSVLSAVVEFVLAFNLIFFKRHKEHRDCSTEST